MPNEKYFDLAKKIANFYASIDGNQIDKEKAVLVPEYITEELELLDEINDTIRTVINNNDSFSIQNNFIDALLGISLAGMEFYNIINLQLEKEQTPLIKAQYFPLLISLCYNAYTLSDS